MESSSGSRHTATQPGRPSPQATGHPSNADASWNGDQLLAALRTASAWLDHHIAQVNALNVFPVPDGDTGTNMSLTMRAALDEAGHHPYPSAAELGRTISHGALMGARGNSGVILSQILRGFARALDDLSTLGAPELAEALKQGAVTAYKGVMKPVEGTILTVAREAADAAAHAAASGAALEETLARAHAEAQASLARTPSLLPVLADAGVVDAGAQGYTYLLEGLLRHLRGDVISLDQITPVEEVEFVHVPDGAYNYDTQFVVRGHDLDLDAMRTRISAMGDSVLVVGDKNAVKVHAHVDLPGQLLDYGVSLGQVNAVIIENMQLQYQEFMAKQQKQPASEPVTVARPILTAEPMCDIAVVAVVSGEGLRRVFESLGVAAIVPRGQTMNPSTQDLLSAIDAVPCEQVIVLPNNANIILAAEQAKQLSSKHVAVLPTKTVPQGIAALLAFNYQADLPTNAQLMGAASQSVQTGEITQAVRNAQVNGLSINEGEIIGLLNDVLVTAGQSTAEVLQELLRRMDADQAEIVTIYYGQDVSPEQAEQTVAMVRQEYPHLEIEVLDGGQAHYHYIISAE
jgi:DAK2 domain fusion protein YloV